MKILLGVIGMALALTSVSPALSATRAAPLGLTGNLCSVENAWKIGGRLATPGWKFVTGSWLKDKHFFFLGYLKDDGSRTAKRLAVYLTPDLQHVARTRLMDAAELGGPVFDPGCTGEEMMFPKKGPPFDPAKAAALAAEDDCIRYSWISKPNISGVMARSECKVPKLVNICIRFADQIGTSQQGELVRPGSEYPFEFINWSGAIGRARYNSCKPSSRTTRKDICMPTCPTEAEVKALARSKAQPQQAAIPPPPQPAPAPTYQPYEPAYQEVAREPEPTKPPVPSTWKQMNDDYIAKARALYERKMAEKNRATPSTSNSGASQGGGDPHWCHGAVGASIAC